MTPEVSQLRGWLKTRASCRGSQAGHTVRGGLRAGGREAAVERGAARAGGSARLQIVGAGRGEQRTLNMPPMSVTRDVFQLKGWLKAVADCRGSQAGHTVRGGLRAGKGDRRRANAECACSLHVGGHVTAGCGGQGAGSSARETCVSCP